MLLLHPEQTVRLKNKQPGLPVGCLIEQLKSEALIDTIEEIVTADNPKEAFENFSRAMVSVLPKRESNKHMAGLDLGRLDVTESLKYQLAA